MTITGSVVVLRTKKVNERNHFYDCVADKNNNAM